MLLTGKHIYKVIDLKLVTVCILLVDHFQEKDYSTIKYVMKKLRFNVIFVLIQILMLNSTFAQKKNAIKFNLLSPIAKTLSFSYERDISYATSTQLGLSFINLKMTGATYSGFFITPEQRIYPAQMGNMKVYVAPFVRYHNANIKTLAFDESGELLAGKASFTSYGGGFIFGGKILFNDFAVLDVYLGPLYSSGEIDVINGGEGHFAHFDLATGLLTGLSFRAGIAIGIAFQ
jgi:hypothetical protein